MRKVTLLSGLAISQLLAGMTLSIRAESKDLPKVGNVAPDFTLKDQDGKSVTLSQYREKELVILYFYPKDETPGCTKEACTFRDDLSWYRKNGVEVLGVSVDNVASHKKFAENHSLNFRILSDANKEVTERYGVLGSSGLANRTTFIVDKEGIIRAVFPNVKVDGHSAELQKTLAELVAAR